MQGLVPTARMSIPVRSDPGGVQAGQGAVNLPQYPRKPNSKQQVPAVRVSNGGVAPGLGNIAVDRLGCRQGS